MNTIIHLYVRSDWLTAFFFFCQQFAGPKFFLKASMCHTSQAVAVKCTNSKLPTWSNTFASMDTKFGTPSELGLSKD